MSATAGAAGTASGCYRMAPVACHYEAEHVEYGERPRCAHCGRAKAAHVPPTKEQR